MYNVRLYITHPHLTSPFYAMEFIVTRPKLYINLKKSMPKMHLFAKRQILINTSVTRTKTLYV